MSNHGSQRGIVLVATLWVLVVLAVLVGAAIETSRLEQQIARNSVARVQARALADAGLALGIKAVIDRNPNDPWPVDSTPRIVSYAGRKIEIAIQDELGKIDLNAAPHESLGKLFAATGVATDRIASLVDAIRDWQDEDNLKHARGAEIDDYRSAGLEYGPRNGLFESIDELEQVKSLSRPLVERLRPALTIYSRSPFVDSATAPRLVLLALVDGDMGRVDEAAAERRSQPSNQATTTRLFDLTARAFTIKARVDMPNGVAGSREMVIRFTGKPSGPFWVYDWH